MLASLRTLCPALSLLLLETTVTAAPAPRAIQRLDGTSITEADLTARIEDLVKKARVHGMAVSIFNGREAVYSRTFGVKRTDTNDPLRTDTVFYGASLSKAVFAVLVMRLVEEGVIEARHPAAQVP